MDLPIEFVPSQNSNPDMTWPPPCSKEEPTRGVYNKGRYLEILAQQRKKKAERQRQKLIKKQRKRNRKRG